MQQPPEVNNQCDFELGVLESSSSDSEKSKSPGKDTAVPLLSSSDDDLSHREDIITGLIPQCNWRFEHCFLTLFPPCWKSSISVLVLILTLVSTGRGRRIRLASKIPFYLL